MEIDTAIDHTESFSGARTGFFEICLGADGKFSIVPGLFPGFAGQLAIGLFRRQHSDCNLVVDVYTAAF